MSRADSTLVRSGSIPLLKEQALFLVCRDLSVEAQAVPGSTNRIVLRTLSLSLSLDIAKPRPKLWNQSFQSVENNSIGRAAEQEVARKIGVITLGVRHAGETLS